MVSPCCFYDLGVSLRHVAHHEIVKHVCEISLHALAERMLSLIVIFVGVSIQHQIFLLSVLELSLPPLSNAEQVIVVHDLVFKDSIHDIEVQVVLLLLSRIAGNRALGPEDLGQVVYFDILDSVLEGFVSAAEQGVEVGDYVKDLAVEKNQLEFCHPLPFVLALEVLDEDPQQFLHDRVNQLVFEHAVVLVLEREKFLLAEERVVEVEHIDYQREDYHYWREEHCDQALDCFH